MVHGSAYNIKMLLLTLGGAGHETEGDVLTLVGDV